MANDKLDCMSLRTKLFIVCTRYNINDKDDCSIVFLVLPIFNEGAYLTFKSVFHKALNLF